ncbi:MAG TPA: hypothetical protein VFQ85_14450 [Mycobacteriales bacterium]|jgi:hypothetical protein|nr:hypothetical protein [Mycobacteriales bacterium]
MRRLPLALLTVALTATAAHAAPPGRAPDMPTGLTASVMDASVVLRWRAIDPDADAVVVQRDGRTLATLPRTALAYDDAAVAPNETHTYTLVTTTSWGNGGKHTSASRPSAPARVTLPAYRVGAAAYDISPDVIGLGTVNQGGNGLGDGTGISGLVGRGSQNRSGSDRIKARAVVFDDGRQAVAIATIETQGYFAAYRDGLKGLSDMARAAANSRMPATSILIASDHTHGGPDTVGAWGGMPKAYFDLVYDRTVRAIRDAYAQRSFADVVAGHSAAYDLIYNQSCPEAVYQDQARPEPGGFPVHGDELPCPTGSLQGSKGTDGKDGLMRVLQARTPRGRVVTTYLAYAAHATAGGGDGVHGDWPQYVGDAMTDRWGGVGIAMEGAVGRTQPCRPACAFTDPRNPGLKLSGRKAQITANYLAHVDDALAHATPVRGPVAAAQSYLREQITGPAVLALFAAGGKGAGARLLRSLDSPWQVGTTIRTVASALRVGDVLFAGTPGEGYPEIAFGIRDALSGPREVVTLGLANDQLGYLIAPAWEYVPITAEAAVNDNTIFNVSPTIGDHVMCSDIRLAKAIGFAPAKDPVLAARAAAYCAPYDAADATGDPVGAVPVGGVSADELPVP